MTPFLDASGIGDHVGRSRSAEAGISLVEVIVATVIAAIAVAGLAHSFGMGRGQIERFAVARAGLAAAEQRMEALSLLPLSHPHMAMAPVPHDTTFVIDGQVIGDIRWTVQSEPVIWGSFADQLTRVDVEVMWDRGFPDTIRLTRLFER